MTGNQIVQQVQRRLGELPGTVESHDWRGAWQDVQDAARELTRPSYCHYKTFTANIAAGNAFLCNSPLFRLKRAVITYADGTTANLALATSGDMDAYVRGWQQAASADKPATLIEDGFNALRLYPPPNYTLSAGVTLEGFGVVGAWALTDECPLPSWVHPSVVTKAALRRIVQNPTPANLARRPMLLDEDRAQMMDLEREARRMNPRTDQGGSPLGDPPPPFYAPQLGYDPLNF